MSKYVVIADFVHHHKDCEGECLLDLEYEEAEKIKKEWQQNKKKYKNVQITKMQGEFS